MRNCTKFVALMLAVGSLGGCAANPELRELSQSETSSLEAQSLPSTASEPEVPSGVSPKAVVLAALLVANGDVASAVEQGLVSPSDVDVAIKAIADGSLQKWVELAES